MFNSGRIEKRLRKISHRLSHFDLQLPDHEDELTTDELDLYLSQKSRETHLFLDFYTEHGLENALEHYGMIQRLRERGFDPKLSICRLDRFRHMFRATDGEGGPLLIELVCRFAGLKIRRSCNGLSAGDLIDLIAIEWLLLQNPKEDFTEMKPRLPGQEHPGLGIGLEVMILLEIMSERLEKEGLLVFPEHYHNGALYNRGLKFFSPQMEGEMRALQRDLAPFDLSEASWAVEQGMIYDADTREIYKWRAEEMIWPRSERFRDYFKSEEYETQAELASSRRFEFDYDQVRLMIQQVRG